MSHYISIFRSPTETTLKSFFQTHRPWPLLAIASEFQVYPPSVKRGCIGCQSGCVSIVSGLKKNPALPICWMHFSVVEFRWTTSMMNCDDVRCYTDVGWFLDVFILFAARPQDSASAPGRRHALYQVLQTRWSNGHGRTRHDKNKTWQELGPN